MALKVALYRFSIEWLLNYSSAQVSHMFDICLCYCNMTKFGHISDSDTVTYAEHMCFWAEIVLVGWWRFPQLSKDLSMQFFGNYNKNANGNLLKAFHKYFQKIQKFRLKIIEIHLEIS